MNSFKLIIAFCLATFITTGLLAQTEIKKQQEESKVSKSDEKTKVSAAQAVSLFNFISLKEEKKDTSKTKTSYDNRGSMNKRNQVIEFFDSIF